MLSVTNVSFTKAQYFSCRVFWKRSESVAQGFPLVNHFLSSLTVLDFCLLKL